MSQESMQLPSPRAPRKPIPIKIKKEKKVAQSPRSKTVGGLVQVNGDFEVVQVVIRVVGVAVGGSKTALKAILKAQGMMQQMISSMSLAMSTNPIPKHEKRVIRLYQSEPFKPTGRPPSYNFKLIYTSEVFAPDELQSMYSGLETDYFGEIYNRDILNPSLVAEVRCQCSMDCRLRLNVYYSSSLTGGKEIVLASTSFSKRELFNAVGIQNDSQNLESLSSSPSSPGRSDRPSIFVSELTSEFCPGSKAYIELSEPLQPALSDSCFRIITFPRAAPLNPLKQRYVFYSDADPLSPIIDAEEIVWEPRFAATVAMLFLQSFTASLSRSIHSWNIRMELERMRQGRFLSVQEAGTYGWQHVTVTVVAARIGTSKVRRERQLQLRSQPAVVPDIVSAPSRGNMHSSRSSMRASTMTIQNTSIVLPYRNYIPVDLEKESNFTKEFETPTAPQPQPPQESATAVDPSVIAPPTPASATTSAASVRFRVDDTAPSSFVQINIEDSVHSFLSPIGRTTTEHYSYWPVYGTNINRSAVRKAAINREASAASDTIEKTVAKKINLFDSYETMDVDFLASVSNKQSDVASTGQGSGGRNMSTDAPSRSESSEILREQVLLETEQVSFSAYIPNSSTNVRFDFCIEDNGKEIRIGNCKLPLLPNQKQSVWLPIEILPSTAIGMEPPCEDIEVYVVVSTENDTASNETVREEGVNEPSIVPPFMSESLFCSQPSPKNFDSNSDQKTVFHNYRKTIADCYEWLWFLGFPGSDPLQVPPLESYTTHSSCGNASSTMADELSTVGETVNESSSEIPSMVGIQLAATYWHPQPSVSSTTDVPAVTSIQRRVDYTYPLPWISSHLNELQELALELRTILPFICDFTLKESSFRASVLKKQHEVQPLPVNLHYQLFCVRPHTSLAEGVSSKKTNDEFSMQYFSRSDLETVGQKIEVVHSITCGAISPHYLGYKNGGLSYQEAILQSNMEELSSVKHKLDGAISKEVSIGGFVRLDGESKVTQLTADLGKKLLSFESSSVSVGKRRAYAMSQALSIAVNAFLLKLSLLVEGSIPKEESEFWMREPGFLILFEGLLSVVNKERTMLEDTIAAVEALKMFRMRLVPDFILKKSSDGPSEAVDAADEESGGEDDSDEDDGFPMEIDIEFSGREVLLYIPFNGFQKLPLFIQNAILSPDGAVVKFYPVLFTQGIDIQQTMVTTFGGDNIKKGQAKSVNLQKDVNDKALKDLNAYCFQTRPIHRRRESLGANTVHPLVQSLSNTILESSISMKNVDLLIEVERVCLILGGCRVTFCKSGKDRTGMAVTLEQSRQLGERFQCGNSQGRLLRDAYTMRLHGVRLSVAEKNIGRRVYAINSLQAQFLPPLFRPPPAVCEDINIMKKDLS